LDTVRLSGKVAIITGGGQGIGFGIAQRFASEGATIVIAQRSLEKADASTAQLRAAGGEACAIRADVTDPGQVDSLVRATLDRYGRLDILVNNAGRAGGNGPVLEIEFAAWRSVIDTNLTGVFLCSQAAARVMVAQSVRGRILNIGSLNCFSAQKNAAAYVASKGGVLMLTKALAVDLAPYGILVNCVAPGSILVERNSPALTAEPLKTSLSKAIPLGGPGSVDHVAAAAAFLASGESEFITGAALIIDGGYLSYARIE